MADREPIRDRTIDRSGLAESTGVVDRRAEIGYPGSGHGPRLTDACRPEFDHRP
jgi:hypothetical protein